MISWSNLYIQTSLAYGSQLFYMFLSARLFPTGVLVREVAANLSIKAD